MGQARVLEAIRAIAAMLGPVRRSHALAAKRHGYRLGYTVTRRVASLVDFSSG